MQRLHSIGVSNSVFSSFVINNSYLKICFKNRRMLLNEPLI